MNFIEGEVLLIDKPLNWTSFDIVNKIRYIIRAKLNLKKIKVGHAGTLDPLATGLLIVCTGKMTKQIESFQAQEKEYITTIKLGATTPSFDKETEEDATFSTDHITKEMIEQTLQKFVGETEQMPPMFSAKKVNGQKAYIAARKGEEIELKPRKIVISSIELQNINMPYIQIKISCSKGTYIRALGRDIGKTMNSGGYLTELRRTKIGDFNVENALEISEFEKNVNNLQLI
ncbi:MAG: tRNA pseudouridine(55) synthase TruB [Salinivirgaceae bacterium]|jgi:tRNA pseudouridine55 synthase|nr:tRNA pseudouridine(55) synthase TruB [Salinivirgaceae bacterium]